MLRTHLEASLLEEDIPAAELTAAAADHQRLRARRADRERPGRERPGRERPGDPDRSRELSARPGWAWTRIVRTRDDYERVLQRLDEERELVSTSH